MYKTETVSKPTEEAVKSMTLFANNFFLRKKQEIFSCFYTKYKKKSALLLEMKSEIYIVTVINNQLHSSQHIAQDCFFL
jgi:hypothetical protein